MQRNLGARTVNTVNFSGNSKIAAEGAIAFDSENRGKNTKIDFIYRLKGFFIFPRGDVIDVRGDVCKVGR